MSIHTPAVDADDWHFSPRPGWGIRVSDPAIPEPIYVWLDKHDEICCSREYSWDDFNLIESCTHEFHERYAIGDSSAVSPQAKFKDLSHFLSWATQRIQQKRGMESRRKSLEERINDWSAGAVFDTLAWEIKPEHGVNVSESVLKELAACAKATGKSIFQTEFFRLLEEQARASGAKYGGRY